MSLGVFHSTGGRVRSALGVQGVADIAGEGSQDLLVVVRVWTHIMRAAIFTFSARTDTGSSVCAKASCARRSTILPAARLRRSPPGACAYTTYSPLASASDWAVGA